MLQNLHSLFTGVGKKPGIISIGDTSYLCARNIINTILFGAVGEHKNVGKHLFT